MGARRWWILVALIVAVLPLALDVGLVTAALPSLSEDLAMGRARSAQVAAVYPVVLALGLGPAVWVLRRVGIRPALLAGGLLAAVGMGVEATAGSDLRLLLGRLVVGVGAAVALPPALAAVHAAFEPVEQPRAVAIWAGFTGLGIALAPLIGGLLVDGHDGTSIFVLQLPPLLLGLALLAVAVPPLALTAPAGRPGWSGVAAPVAVFLLAGVAVALMFRLQQHRQWSATAGGALLALPATVFSVAARAVGRRVSRGVPVAGLVLAGLSVLGLTTTDDGLVVGLLLGLLAVGAAMAVAGGPTGRSLDPLLRTLAAGLGIGVLGSLEWTGALQVGAAVALVGAVGALLQPG